MFFIIAHGVPWVTNVSRKIFVLPYTLEFWPPLELFYSLINLWDMTKKTSSREGQNPRVLGTVFL